MTQIACFLEWGDQCWVEKLWGNIRPFFIFILYLSLFLGLRGVWYGDSISLTYSREGKEREGKGGRRSPR